MVCSLCQSWCNVAVCSDRSVQVSERCSTVPMLFISPIIILNVARLVGQLHRAMLVKGTVLPEGGVVN
jgi:hypothetical protein